MQQEATNTTNHKSHHFFTTLQRSYANILKNEKRQSPADIQSNSLEQNTNHYQFSLAG